MNLACQAPSILSEERLGFVLGDPLSLQQLWRPGLTGECQELVEAGSCMLEMSLPWLTTPGCQGAAPFHLIGTAYQNTWFRACRITEWVGHILICKINNVQLIWCLLRNRKCHWELGLKPETCKSLFSAWRDTWNDIWLSCQSPLLFLPFSYLSSLFNPPFLFPSFSPSLVPLFLLSSSRSRSWYADF